MSEPILLTDEQMREFIVNGYLVFEPTVPEGTHEMCSRKLNEIIDSEVEAEGEEAPPPLVPRGRPTGEGQEWASS